MPCELKIKLNIRYVDTSNVKTEDGVVNGTMGLLRHITLKSDSQTVDKLSLDFQNDAVGQMAKSSHAPKLRDSKQYSATFSSHRKNFKQHSSAEKL